MNYPQSETEKQYTPTNEQPKDYEPYTTHHKFWFWIAGGAFLILGFITVMTSWTIQSWSDNELEKYRVGAPLVAKELAAEIKQKQRQAEF